MNVVFVAPLSKRRRALAVETRRAADAGHRVFLVAEDTEKWKSEVLDERVQIRWIGAFALTAEESPLVTFFARRLPLGLLRRAARGPLRRRAKRLSRKWRRKVVKRLDRKLKRRTGAMRRERRVEQVRSSIVEWRPDWLVLHEPTAIDICADFLPDLLESEPEMKTTYVFEPLLEQSGVDGR